MAPRRSAPAKKMTKKRMSSKKISVVKKVDTLSRQVKKLTKVAYENVDVAKNIAQNENLINPYNVHNISKTFFGSGAIWGYNSSDIANVDRAYLNRKRAFVSVRQNNEPNLIRYSMFLVSLKDQGADTTTFDPATGTLTLTGGTHYTSLGSDQVALSPRFFNVHAVRRFTMGYEGSAGPTADTRSERRFIFDIRPRKLVQNPKGNMFANAAFEFPKDPSLNYFILTFNDNVSTDLESNRIDIQVTDTWAIAS